jgi:hypothetical protein
MFRADVRRALNTNRALACGAAVTGLAAAMVGVYRLLNQPGRERRMTDRILAGVSVELALSRAKTRRWS